ncbi:unnamed protein product, partial [Didymodactylos carnosus]
KLTTMRNQALTNFQNFQTQIRQRTLSNNRSLSRRHFQEPQNRNHSYRRVRHVNPNNTGENERTLYRSQRTEQTDTNTQSQNRDKKDHKNPLSNAPKDQKGKVPNDDNKNSNKNDGQGDEMNSRENVEAVNKKPITSLILPLEDEDDNQLLSNDCNGLTFRRKRKSSKKKDDNRDERDFDSEEEEDTKDKEKNNKQKALALAPGNSSDALSFRNGDNNILETTAIDELRRRECNHELNKYHSIKTTEIQHDQIAKIASHIFETMMDKLNRCEVLHASRLYIVEKSKMRKIADRLARYVYIDTQKIRVKQDMASIIGHVKSTSRSNYFG